MKEFLESRKAAYIFLTGCGLFFLYIIVNYYGANDNYAGDGLRHYLVSRWCWIHPDLLLYHWGKPFFTIITSFFSQFGHKGIQVFNLIASLWGAYFLYKICRFYEIKNSTLVIPIAFFIPLYFAVINTGLTEPLFFFMIASCAYLMLKEKYMLSSIIISFLPFVRSEGNMIIMTFLFVLLLRRQLKYIPLLLTGTFLYSVIGGFYFHDFLWVFTQNPYNGQNKAIYGHGELLFFIKSYDFILGLPLTILFVAGLIVYILNSSRQNIIQYVKNNDVEIIILLGSALVYFVAHSIFWWKGLFNSLGLVRAIAGIVPLVAITCLRGFNKLQVYIPEKLNLRIAFLIFVISYVVYYPIKKKYFPPQINAEDKVASAALSWFKNSPYKNNLIYYLNPYIAEQLDRDPFDPKQVRELWGLLYTIRDYGYNAIPDSTVIFWDSHFGPNESHISLDSISADPNFELLKVFKPEVPFTTLGGYDFGIYLFMKVQPSQKSSLAATLSFDLETTDGLQNEYTITDKDAYSGKMSCELNDKTEFSITYQLPIKDLYKIGLINKINYSIYVKSNSPKLNDAKVVVSIMDKDKTIEWISQDLITAQSEKGIWAEKDFEFKINPQAYEGNNPILKIYVWNTKKEEFFIDNLEIKFIGLKQ